MSQIDQQIEGKKRHLQELTSKAEQQIKIENEKLQSAHRGLVQRSGTLSREIKDLKAKNQELESSVLQKEHEYQLLKVKFDQKLT